MTPSDATLTETTPSDDTDHTPAADGGRAFAELPLDDALLAAVAEVGYTRPTPVQAKAIGPLVAGRDLLGQAATGTGKTAAFALPMLQRLATERLRQRRGRAPFGLVLTPTRELALQVADVIERFGRRLDARVITVYGGASVGAQTRALAAGADVVVATPGRAIDLHQRGALRLDEVRVVVLDEADEMLDMGFVEDIETILAATPADRQTALFSATIPRRIEELARAHLTDPVTVRIGRQDATDDAVPRIRQLAYLVPRTHTTAALARVLEVERPRAAIVFCRTRLDVDAVTEALTARGLRAEALHGGMDQEHRTRVVERLRTGRTELLVATDVAARGLDIDLLTHVVNHDVPQSPETYVHRIGRVGRAGRAGVAITLVPPSKLAALRAVERFTGQPVTITPVPTAADLRAARLRRTQDALRERLRADAASPNEFDSAVRAMLAELVGEFDPMDIAAAAVRLAHEAAGAVEDTEDIPVVTVPRERRGDRRGERPVKARNTGGRPPKVGTTRLFVSAGRASGVRPQDIVGALAGESPLSGRDIGAIQIHERHALVEVPEHAVEAVLRSLRGGTMLKGRRASVRRDRAFADHGRRRRD